MARKLQKLTEKELRAQEEFSDKLHAKRRRTGKPIMVAMIGLVGSGKSAVAKYLADLIGATVVCGDDIRVELRKHGLGYDSARLIGENVAGNIISQGRNVIMDSDFVDKNKRESIRQVAKKVGAKLVYIRTICDFDVLSQRIRENDPGEFFNSASSKSTAKDKGRDVKFREMDRRKPQHYRWENKGGGRWISRKISVTYTEVDTTTDAWKAKTQLISASILKN